MALSDLLLCLLITLSAAASASADSIHGCGGFVEASSPLIKSRKTSDRKLDYSHITVELQTVDGLVKERTQCAPNGYYFIPVYDKGSFIVKVKGPDGWSWDPDNVPVIIDHNGCNSNADINFRFTGFTVSGRVMGAIGGESCSLKDGGPSGVKIELLLPSDDLIASALTSSTGEYSFKNIIPGKYKLRASHPNLRVEVRGSSEVDLGFGNIVVDNIFFVTGYDLHGFVVAQGNPILGVHLYLYSDDVKEVHCSQGLGTPPIQRSSLCHATSGPDGKFTFTSIPCGVYELLPYYKGENTVFDVSPPSMIVSIEHRHHTISQRFQDAVFKEGILPYIRLHVSGGDVLEISTNHIVSFEVTGFSVGGRVVDGNDAGVDGVKVLVDGQWRATTDDHGFYKLDQVTSKQYSITALKDHYKFSSLENFLVLPNIASIDDIKAIYYDICGVARMDTTNSRAKVALTHGPENFKPKSKLTKEDGSFCFEVLSGEYRLSALPVSPESSGLLFSPSYVDLKVNSPLLNIEFDQAQVNVHGTVLCKDKCDQSIFVSLVRLTGGRMNERKTIALSYKSSDFIFARVFPGKYQLEIKHVSSPSMPEDDSWCWDHSVIDLDVGIEDINNVVFVQKGYWVDIVSSHDTNSYIIQPDSSRVDLVIKKGAQRVCVENPGQHELYLVNTCILFGNSSVKFNTLDVEPIYLTGEKYLLKGEIHIRSPPQNAVDLSERIIVDIFDNSGELFDTVHTRFVSDGSQQNGVAVYEYSIWSNLGQEFLFVPRDSSNGAERNILFYPRQRNVSVATVGCQATVSPILGRVGLYLEGSVSPPLAGVSIRIIAAGESSYAPVQKGDLVLETNTGSDGSFAAGPLYDDLSYKIEASKPGYHLKEVGPNSFTCQKLGQILVHIYDGGETGELLPSVLLSLSGEDGYRNNSISGTDGTFSFDDLFPGSFYLRPLLKEYSFSPMAEAIELESGESKEVVFHATRVAYSVMGTVSVLSGQPKEGVYIEARSESKGYYEESKTDHLGNFRLRGLLPDTTYLIKVVTKEDYGVERASPESVTVNVVQEDIRGANFVVFEKPEISILSGHAEGIDLEKFQPHLSVEIKLASNPAKIQAVFALPLSYYFQVRDLPKSKHIVQLRSGLSSATHRFESEILEVDLEKEPQVHVGPLRYKVEEYQHKQEPTPAPLFPIIVGVSVIALFISMPRLKDLYQTAVEMAPMGSSTANSKKEVRKPVLKRRVLQ